MSPPKYELRRRNKNIKKNMRWVPNRFIRPEQLINCENCGLGKNCDLHQVVFISQKITFFICYINPKWVGSVDHSHSFLQKKENFALDDIEEQTHNICIKKDKLKRPILS
jgi:hypothetical protein